jgi:4-amino-4-deoxy-L-arabinose transferase-like glycosyltransferase
VSTTNAPAPPAATKRGSGRSSQRRWPVEAADRRLLALIVAVGLALRVAWAIYAARPPVGLQDPTFYQLFAESIAEGQGYRLPGDIPTAYYPVGYSAALGAVAFVAFNTPLPDDLVWLAVALNLAMAALSFVLVFEIARRLFDRRVALVATAIVALFPNLVFHTALTLTETLFNTLALAAVLVVVATDWSRRRLVSLVLFGVLVGVSALVRPPSLLFVAALAVAGWWGARWSLKETARSVLVATVTAVAVIAPWTVRNIAVMGEPVIISTNTGDNLCIGNNPDADGGFQMPPSCLDGFDHLDRPEYELARDAHGRAEGLRYIVENPLDQFRLVPLRLYRTLATDTDGIAAAESYGQDPFIGTRVRTVLEVVANGFYYLTMLLGLVAAPRFFRGRHASRLFVAVATASLLVPPLLFFGDARFKVPLIPFVAIAAATTVVTLADRFRNRSASGAAGAEDDDPAAVPTR